MSRQLRVIPRKLAKELGCPSTRLINPNDYSIWKIVSDGYSRQDYTQQDVRDAMHMLETKKVN